MWTATVPPAEGGEYIVELTAWDAAGNVQYTTKYLLAIDYTALCVHLIPLQKYVLQNISSQYSIEIVQNICKEREGIRI